MRQNFAPLARRLVLCVFVLALGVRSARADGFISPFVGFSFGGDASNCPSLTDCQHHRTNWGVSVGTGHGIFGFEEDISWVPEFYAGSGPDQKSVLTITSNMMLRVADGPFRPYALLGFAFVRPHTTVDAAGLDADRNVLGYDIGGGLNLFLQQHIGFHSDVRHIRTIKDLSLGVFNTEQLEYWRGSTGVIFRW